MYGDRHRSGFGPWYTLPNPDAKQSDNDLFNKALASAYAWPFFLSV
jgi:hypothetical protein